VDLVLGAWGCGVFGNDPATVAKLFNEALIEFSCFRRVIFAVLDPKMASVFSEEFQVFVESSEEAPASHTKEPKDPAALHGKAARKQKQWLKAGANEDS